MAVKSIYCADPRIEDGRLEIQGEEHRHLRVSRTEAGEAVEVFDGRGRVWRGEVAGWTRAATEVRVLSAWTAPARSAEIILAAPLIKPASFEWMLEKSVEIGVSRIVPFRASRSNEAGRGREARWRRIVIEAAKQSKRYHLPVLDPVTDLAGVTALDCPSKIVFSERGGGRLAAALRGAPALYAVGPEGGWTDGELAAAAAAGMQPVHLGAGILRTETAAIVGGALIAYELDGL